MPFPGELAFSGSFWGGGLFFADLLILQSLDVCFFRRSEDAGAVGWCEWRVEDFAPFGAIK